MSTYDDGNADIPSAVVETIRFPSRAEVESLRARVAELERERDALREEVGLTHERLDELDTHEPLSVLVPRLVNGAWREIHALRAERAQIREQVKIMLARPFIVRKGATEPDYEEWITVTGEHLHELLTTLSAEPGAGETQG